MGGGGRGGRGDLEGREEKKDISGSIRYWRGWERGTEGLEKEQKYVAGRRGTGANHVRELCTREM